MGFSRLSFQYMSDLHLEKYPIPKLEIKAPYLILAGDIGNPFSDRYRKFIDIYQKEFQSIFMISGNHEYYQMEKTPVKTMKDVNDQINNVASKYRNVHFLNNSFVDIFPELRLIGCTLWATYLNTPGKGGDFKNIYKTPTENITVRDVQNFHTQDKFFLTRELLSATRSSKKLLVITHHLPSFTIVRDEYKNRLNTKNFYSDSDWIIRKPIVGWVCGHSHGYVNKVVNDVPIFLNAAGNSVLKRDADLVKTLYIKDDYRHLP